MSNVALATMSGKLFSMVGVEVPHFTCPKCDKGHDRGWFGAVGTFRCLWCGYVGHGYHPDSDIDGEVFKQDLESEVVNAMAGVPWDPNEWHAFPRQLVCGASQRSGR